MPVRTTAHQDFLLARDTLLRCGSDHSAACRAFQWPTFDHFNWAHDWFDVIAAGNETPALRLIGSDGERTLSFNALARQSDRTAAWLQELGIERGDPVLLLLDNRAELWELLLALMKLRAIAVPMFVTVTAAELAQRMERAAVRHIVADTSLAMSVTVPPALGARIAVGAPVPGWTSYRAAAEYQGTFQPDGPTSADEVLCYYFTSGTTSRPKLVVHTHVSYPVGHLSSMYWNGLQPGDVHLNISAPGWAKHPWSSVFAPWNAEATVVSMDSGSATPSRVLDALERTAATSFCAPPSMWRRLIRAGLSGCSSQLREAVSVGEPLTQDIVDEVAKAWSVTVRNGYGQSEVTALTGVSRCLDADPTSLGRPLPGYRIVLCPPGADAEVDEGELCVDLTDLPLGMMRGYLDEPQAAPHRTRYRTGDLARWEDNGCLSYLGRCKDVFTSVGGERVNPVELERVLLNHGAVAEIAVVPVTDEDGLQAKAFVVLAPHWNATAATAEAIHAYTQKFLPADRRIAVVEFIDDLPRTESGKVRRDALRSYRRSSLLEFAL